MHTWMLIASSDANASSMSLYNLEKPPMHAGATPPGSASALNPPLVEAFIHSSVSYGVIQILESGFLVAVEIQAQ